MAADRSSIVLPMFAQKPRVDWGARVAKGICTLLALVGALPLLATLLVRMPWVRERASTETAKVARTLGIRASYQLALHLWPLSVELTDLRVESTDNQGPALTAPKAFVRPRFFALLAGKVVIDQVELASPRVRVVMTDKRIVNLGIDLPESKPGEKSGPFHAPFGVVSMSNAALDLSYENNHLELYGVDADVSAEDDPRQGSTLEGALRANRIALTRTREDMEGGYIVLATDEDELCGVDGRFRFEPPGTILVRRFSAHGGLDLDPGVGTFPGCSLADTDPRKLELTLGHLTVRLPEAGEKYPRASGHVAVRAPIAATQRIPGAPDTDGWVSLDAEVRYSPQDRLPEADGVIKVKGAKVDKFALNADVESHFSIHRDVVASAETKVKIFGGDVTLTNVAVEPFTEGIPIRATLSAKNASLEEILRGMAVHEHPHVGWDILDVEVPLFKGTVKPLKLDGDLTASTSNFAIWDKPADNPARERIIGVKSGVIAGKVLVRPEGLIFDRTHVTTPHSVIDGLHVLIGFHDKIAVDVPAARVDLADISPVGSLKLSGIADASTHVYGPFGDPVVEGDAKVQNFSLADIPFGNITAAHAKVLKGRFLELTGVKAIKNKSAYEMPSARIDFGGGAAMALEADVTSSDFGLRDFFALWKMDEDPRFLELDAHLETQVGLRVTLGGPEDVCGGGLVQVSAKAHARDVKLFGERFDDGHLDFDYNWVDQRAGIEGADVQVRSFALHKVHKPGRPTSGSVLGSASIVRGGTLRGNAVFDGLALSRIDTLGVAQELLAGSVSGIATVGGTVTSFTVLGNADVTPVRVNGVPYGSSQLHFKMTQTSEPSAPIGKTRCGGAIAAPFNREAYFRDLGKPQGEFVVDGSLLGGQILLDAASITREANPIFKGRIGLRKVDVGAISRVISPPDDVEWDEEAKELVGGTVSGDLVLGEFATAHPTRARATFAPTAITITASGQKVELVPSKSVIELKNDTVSLPPLTFRLEAGGGFSGSFAVNGSVRNLTKGAQLDLSADIAPIDLSMLPSLIPRLTRSAGKLTGSLRITGAPTQPDIDGAMHLRGGEFVVPGIPSVSDLNLDLSASESEVRLTWATAKFAGGDVVLMGRMPIKGASMGQAEATIVGRELHLSPADGMRAVLDCDLGLSGNLLGKGGTKRLPRVTGSVLLTSMDYSRPVNLDFTQGLNGTATRTSVESYDPSLDAIAFDITVNAKAPVRVKNNLADFQLGFGPGGLVVSGTNQRMGLRGELRALPGGRLSFLANEFELNQVSIKFDDATRIAAHVDAIAVTEYKRYTSAAAASGAGAARASGSWRIALHAYGPSDNLKLDMSSEPTLSQEDISLLLTVGLTKAEADQLGTNALSVFAYEAAGTATGADRAVKKYIPVDDFRFGSAYSPRTGRSEPNFTIGKRLTPNVQANITSGISEDRQIRTSVEWRLSRATSLQGSYDNANTIGAAGFGNLGMDFRWRLEFE